MLCENRSQLQKGSILPLQAAELRQCLLCAPCIRILIIDACITVVDETVTLREESLNVCSTNSVQDICVCVLTFLSCNTIFVSNVDRPHTISSILVYQERDYFALLVFNSICQRFTKHDMSSTTACAIPQQISIHLPGLTCIAPAVHRINIRFIYE